MRVPEIKLKGKLSFLTPDEMITQKIYIFDILLTI